MPDEIEGISVRVIATIGSHQFSRWSEFERSIDPSPFSNTDSPLIPATAITSTTGTFTDQDLSHISATFASDDVWNDGFLQVILLQTAESTVVEYNGPSKVICVPKDKARLLPNGPYLIDVKSGKVHAVARLYEDPNHALIGGGIAYDTSSNKYQFIQSSRYLVPSKLYYETSRNKPLAGLRFAVKDVIDIAGLPTGNGSRGWRDVYPTPETSAPFIDQLTNAGAILVGKANCTQFCDGQDASERFEEVTPFNPRGDGYQKPSSSSSGSAAASAAYAWIDFTIGTDTGGSIRHPAGVNGVYGLRPSINSVESKGMVASSYMDTVGIFARSAEVLEKVQKVLSGPVFTFTRPQGSGGRYKLLYLTRPKDADPTAAPRLFPQPGQTSQTHAQAESILEKFVSSLEKRLHCKREPIVIEDLWASTHPESMPPSISKATGTIYQRMVYYSTATKVIAPFIKDYQSLRNGQSPFLEPVFKARIDYGLSVTEKEYEEAINLFQTFRTWLHNVLFAAEPDVIPILVYPQSWGIPAYRDETNPPPKETKPQDIFWEGFSLYSMSYVGGGPDVTVPLGEVPYASRITQTEEWLPVSASVISVPEMDRVVTSLLRDLEADGALRPVAVGKRMYMAQS